MIDRSSCLEAERYQPEEAVGLRVAHDPYHQPDVDVVQSVLGRDEGVCVGVELFPEPPVPGDGILPIDGPDIEEDASTDHWPR